MANPGGGINWDWVTARKDGATIEMVRECWALLPYLDRVERLREATEMAREIAVLCQPMGWYLRQLGDS